MLMRLRALRRRRSAGALVLLLGLLAVGTGYSAAIPAPPAQDTAAQSQQIDAGRRLYVVSCSSCHGRNAEGGTVGKDTKNTFAGPPLIGVGSAAVDFQVGTGRMPAMQPGAQMPRKDPVFNEAETAALSAYIASLGDGTPIPAESAYDTSRLTDEEITKGGMLYRTNRAACHNFAGKGGALPRGRYAPTLEGVSAKHMYEAMLVGPQQMPVFSDQVLTGDDKRAIIGYLQQIENQSDPGGFNLGRLGPTSEGLYGWIFGIGALVGFATWIAYRGAKVPRKSLTAAAHDVDETALADEQARAEQAAANDDLGEPK